MKTVLEQKKSIRVFIKNKRTQKLTACTVFELLQLLKKLIKFKPESGEKKKKSTIFLEKTQLYDPELEN